MPNPLGAHPDGNGTAFAVWSGVAIGMDLCLFAPDGSDERRIPMTGSPEGVWQAYVLGAGPGQRYGFRARGPWDPDGTAALCDPHRLLLDPYARAIDGVFDWHASLFAGAGLEGRPGTRKRRSGRRSPVHPDSGPHMPRSVVVQPAFDWGGDRPLATPLHRTVIYEAHVKGLSMRHPAVPPELRGTYAGLAHPALIEHLHALGVTALELLPVHAFVQDERLLRLGLRNYWGYNTIGFFAPERSYATTAAQAQPDGPVRELKAAIRALHGAGIEVLLDVVYNHTAEGDERGPILSFKGLDNAAYYRIARTPADGAWRYDDVTATGNTLNARDPVVTRLILDSLRAWVAEYHVDGFRFDLAGSLGRIHGDFDPQAPLLEAIRRDPVLGRAKLIAEPWDPGPAGYAGGRFPGPWSEWNDRFRDTARRLWQGTLPSPAELGFRLTASHDRYGAPDRLPTASVNYVTAHDGFTLADVVAYDEKHNEANGEANHDGSGHEISWNRGAEGPTADPGINAARRRDRRNLLATLFLAQGVPMLLGGDELGRTQHGNNNAYCQDSDVSWLDWSAADTPEGRAFLDFVRRLVALRAGHPALSRRHWVGEGATHLVAWFDHDGQPMTPSAWESGPMDGLVMRLGVEDLVDEAGVTWPADPLLVVVHAADDPHQFRLPAAPGRRAWRVVLDTAAPDPFPTAGLALVPGDRVLVPGRSVLVLQGLGVKPGPRPPGIQVSSPGGGG